MVTTTATTTSETRGGQADTALHQDTFGSVSSFQLNPSIPSAFRPLPTTSYAFPAKSGLSLEESCPNPSSNASDYSPKAETPTTKVAEPLTIPSQPFPHLFPSAFSPSSSDPEVSRSRTSRRGSLLPIMRTSDSSAHRRGSDPSAGWASIEMSRVTPRSALAGEAASVGPSRAGERPGSQGLRGGHSSSKAKTQTPDEGTRTRTSDATKEEMALAKWRKLAVELPIQPGLSDVSLPPSRKASPAGSHRQIPSHPTRSPASSSHSLSSSARPGLPLKTGSNESPLSPLGSRSDFQPVSPSDSFHVEQEGTVIHATETVRALRDVELAIDESVLAINHRSIPQHRRISTNPRLVDSLNPFIEIAARLGSRRVRPIVIELIQALGHYIDAVWTLRYPHTLCPWIDIATPTEARGSISRRLVDDRMWKSRAITAVQEGKTRGFVHNPQSMADVKFWGDEVRHGLKDVNDVVGIFKGTRWAFSTALESGKYGEIVSSNVLGQDGSGGNIARMLNDLEEAIWGDAQPRSTDLDYELPLDFDPYAEVTEEELAASGAGGPSLASFFDDSASTPTTQHTATPLPDNVYDVVLPDLLPDSGDAPNVTSLSPSTPTASTVPAQRFDPLGLDAFRIEGKEMTLEEIGRRRHQEWLQSRAQAVGAVI